MSRKMEEGGGEQNSRRILDVSIILAAQLPSDESPDKLPISKARATFNLTD